MDTASERQSLQWPHNKAPWILGLAAVLIVAACASQDGPEERSILSTRSGETQIQVTESEEGGATVVRIKTTFRGEESTIAIVIDEPNYEIEIPLSIGQQQPAAAAGGAAGGGQFSDLLAAQYIEKAQEAMLSGDYNAALRQINLVLSVQPDNVQALMMKGSVYYAMGNYQLANEQFEQVLVVDPSNEEVRRFQEFLGAQQDITQPNLPATAPEPAPEPPPEE